MNYTEDRSLKLYLSSFWWALVGMVVLYLFPGRNWIYAGAIALFSWGCFGHVRTIVANDQKRAVFWLLISTATFAGDVVSTLLASGFSYEMFVRVELNSFLVASLDPDRIILSGVALMAIKLFLHLWTFSGMGVWETLTRSKRINYADLASVTFWQHFRYSRVSYMGDSWCAFRGKPVHSRPELELMTFMSARYLPYMWGVIYSLVTVNNLVVMMLFRAETAPMLVLHRGLFYSALIMFASADTISYFLARQAAETMTQAAETNGMPSEITSIETG
jgi:hypothetical protein